MLHPKCPTNSVFFSGLFDSNLPKMTGGGDGVMLLFTFG